MSRAKLKTADHRGALGILLLLLLLLPFLLLAIFRVETSTSSVHPWFPDDTEERDTYLRFEKIFGAEDFWLLSYSAAVGEEKLADLVHTIEQRNTSLPKLLKEVRSSYDLLIPQPGLDTEALRERLRGVFFDSQGERGVVFARSSEYGFRNRNEVFNQIFRPILEQEAKTDNELYITGPGYLGVMADAETRRTLALVTPFTFVLSALLAFFVLRDIRLTAIAMLVSGISAAIPIAIIYYTGKSLSHLLVVVPSLAQLLSLSNAIHLIQYYRELGDLEKLDRPWLSAWKKGWLPTVAASVTTAIGFLSLQMSSMPVVRSFSTYGAIGVCCAMVVVLLLVPVGIILLQPRNDQASWVQNQIVPPLSGMVCRFPWVVSILLMGVLTAACFGIPQLKTEVRMETFFSPRSEFIRQHNWFQQHFGDLQSSQLFGEFPPGATLSQQLQTIFQIEKAFPEEEETVTLISPFTFYPMTEAEIDRLPEAIAGVLEEKFESEGLLLQSAEGNKWQITLYHPQAPDLSSCPIQKKISDLLDELHHKKEAGNWAVTGTYFLFGDAQETLLKELLRTFLLAFILVVPCVILFLRNVPLGFIALIGNLFPIAVFFGALGFLGQRIDIATMVIGSIAFGVAVDDTIHFLTWLAREKRDHSIEDRVRIAYVHAGAAILKTTLIISVGMLAFLLSDFTPSRRFALFTSIVLGLAVVGDLLLLPALLLGPLRRLFSSRNLKNQG